MKEHPPKRVNENLRKLLTQYISFFPESFIPGLPETVSDITGLMELLETMDGATIKSKGAMQAKKQNFAV
ncbi:MAG: hypothetical protein QM640_02265 [Niabella sp.]